MKSTLERIFSQPSSSSRKSLKGIFLVGVLGTAVISSPVALASVEVELGLESRFFFEDGFLEQEKFQPSVRADLEHSSDLGEGQFVTKVFGRYDLEDRHRTHLDLREALWTYYADEFELKAGVGKVFWGVTESRHLVDVINQTDAAENPDGEDKLGQAMIKLSTEKDWGTLDFFLLPHFRERTFTSIEDGRLPFLPFQVIQSGLPFKRSKARYESGAEEYRGDIAIRYSHYVGELEFALSHFSGTSREARVVLDTSLSSPAFVPYYDVVDQTGLELQYIYDSWLLKFEGITNSGFDPAGRYSAAVAGFEYTQVGIFDSAADLGWLVEYLFDDRKEDATHFVERDVFVGWRYAFNDADSSEILAGFIYDPKTEESMVSFEASKRLAADIKLNIEARLFNGAETDNALKTSLLKDEDYLQLELVKYF